MLRNSESQITAVEEQAPPVPAWSRWTRRLGIAFVAVVIAALVGLLTLGLLTKGETGGGLLRLSREAPDFTLTTFSGSTFSLSENLGKPVVVNFWASWCESCKEEAEALEEAWRAFGSEGVVFIGVNVQDKRGDALEFLSRYSVTYPNGPDEDDIYSRYGAVGVPETFFIDREGTIVLKFMGPLNADQISAFVEELSS